MSLGTKERRQKNGALRKNRFKLSPRVPKPRFKKLVKNCQRFSSFILFSRAQPLCPQPLSLTTVAVPHLLSLSSSLPLLVANPLATGPTDRLALFPCTFQPQPVSFSLPFPRLLPPFLDQPVCQKTLFLSRSQWRGKHFRLIVCPGSARLLIGSREIGR